MSVSRAVSSLCHTEVYNCVTAALYGCESNPIITASAPFFSVTLISYSCFPSDNYGDFRVVKVKVAHVALQHSAPLKQAQTFLLMQYFCQWAISPFLKTNNSATRFRYLWPPCVADADIIFWSYFFLFLSFSSPNLSGRRLDVYHASSCGVALVRI